MNNLPANAGLIYLLATLFGLIFGSFGNVVIYRLPKMLAAALHTACYVHRQDTEPMTEAINLAKPNSTCPHCQTAICIWDNIPLLSYCLLKGKCRYCKHAIAWHYPLVEALMALFFLFNAYYFGLTWQMVMADIFCFTLLCLFMIDWQQYILPDELTLGLLWLGLLNNVLLKTIPINSAVLGAAIGYLFFWTLNKLFKLFCQKEGLGYGDFKLLAALGAWFGWENLPLIVLMSALIGLGFALIWKLAHREAIQAAFPFGPALALTGWIFLYTHPLLLQCLYSLTI